MKRRTGWLFATFGLVTLAWGCAQERAAAPPATEEMEAEEAAPSVDHAVAVLHATEGHEATGVVRFTREGEGVHVSVRIEGLKAGDHGFHVHEFGDCSKPDGTSAGGHFNPFDEPHGGRDAAERHVGDLGNVTADESGVAEAEFVDGIIALEGEASIIGRGVIVHAGADDLESQPTGAAGARAACGVIGIAGGAE
jgi:Cu-Zn family superoxide dismutase